MKNTRKNKEQINKGNVYDPDIMDKEKVHKQSEECKEKQRANQQRKRSNPDIRKKEREKVHKQNEEYKEKQRANQQRKRSDPDIRKKEKATFRNKYH